MTEGGSIGLSAFASTGRDCFHFIPHLARFAICAWMAGASWSISSSTLISGTLVSNTYLHLQVLMATNFRLSSVGLDQCYLGLAGLLSWLWSRNVEECSLRNT